MSYARFGSPMVEMTIDEYTKWNERQRKAIDALDDPVGWGDQVPEDLRGSDVYVYLDCYGYLCCCGCSLGGHSFYSTDDMLAHLQEHVDAGHRVPPKCIDRLTADRDENDRWIEAESK